MLRVIWLVLVLLVLLVLFVAVLLGHGAGKVLHHLVSGGAFRVYTRGLSEREKVVPELGTASRRHGEAQHVIVLQPAQRRHHREL
jgi:hypothetical protein